MAHTSIILVNYNGTADTIECLQSLHISSHKNYNVFLIDNGSSIDHFEDYLLKIKTESKNFNRVFVIADSIVSERNKLAKIHFDTFYPEDKLPEQVTDHPDLILVFNESNTGFASANNIGIRIAQKTRSENFWLLNNDTVIEKNSLSSLINFSTRLKTNGNKVGLVGSKILFYNNRNTIQTVGGVFNPFTSRQYHKGLNEIDNGQYDNDKVKIDYPYGASIFFDNNFLTEVGSMNEKYFLYFEELDWAVRAKRKGYESRLCFESKVFHKQGNATGKKMNKKRSPFNTCLKSRNLLLFYVQHYIAILPVAWLRLLFNATKAFLNNDFAEGKMITRVLFGFRDCFLIQQKKD